MLELVIIIVSLKTPWNPFEYPADSNTSWLIVGIHREKIQSVNKAVTLFQIWRTAVCHGQT